MSLALSTLLYEWRRYMAAIVALAFSGLLVLAQVGMFMGIGKAFTAQIDRARADIMILSPGATALFNGGPSGVPRRIMPVVYQHPEVLAVADLDGSGGRWQNIVKDKEPGAEPAAPGAKKMEFVNVTTIDAMPGAVTVPVDYSDDLVEALRQPYAVAVDQTALGRLGVKLGDQATYNGKNLLNGGTGGTLVTFVADVSGTTLTLSTGTSLSSSTTAILTSAIGAYTSAGLYASAIANISVFEGIVNSMSAEIAAQSRSIKLQKGFVDDLVDATKKGLGALVDADVASESATLQSLQVRQQLNIQALSIANQQPNTLLSLFR